MTTSKPDSGMGAVNETNKDADWASFVPKSVDAEDSLGVEANKRVWEALYKAAGSTTATEQERKAIRAGVYMYCAKNGTSREGDYSGNIQLSTGKVISAAVIPRAATRLQIRKFLRANMMESYDFFKKSRCMEADDRFVAKCAALGISPDNAFATADWLADCPMFTPGESKAHSASFTRGLERSRRSRGGRTLEDVEAERVDEGLKVQGPANERHVSSDSW